MRQHLLINKVILKYNGVYLMVMGIFGGVADVMGYFFDKGPFGEVCFQNNLTIGIFEAHCLAIVLGFILFANSKKDNSAFYHKIAISIELVLFVANIVWFNIFRETNTVAIGYVVTIAHFIFITLNAFVVIKFKETKGDKI